MRRILWLIPFTLVVLLSACTTTVDTNLGKDGTGTVATSVGMTQAELNSLSSLSGSTGSFCDSIQPSNSLPSQVTIHQEQRGDQTWCVATQSFQDLNELQSIYGELGNVQVNQLDMTDGHFTYDVNVDMTNLTTEGIDPNLLKSVKIDFKWNLTLPGAVGDNNADSVAGQQLTWTLTPGQTAHLHAESTRSSLPAILPQTIAGSGWLPSWLVPVVIGLLCLDGIIVIVLAVVVLGLIRRRSSKE